MSNAARMSRRRLLALSAAAGGAALPGFAASPPSSENGPQPLVLTATQAAFSLTSALVVGTGIEVRNIPADARELALLKDYIQRRFDALSPVFASAAAVVTLTNALPLDPLYRFARQANVRIVNIDAAIPWQFDMPGVALTDTPRSNAPWTRGEPAGTATAPYLWLSFSNAIRMADIIRHDLSALFPDAARTISGNLDALRRSLLAMRSGFLQNVAAKIDSVFALTGDLVYFTNDLGIFIDGYFIKQDVSWTDGDLAALTRHLKDREIKVVLHRWEPSDAIVDAVRSGGAGLAVLDTADPGLIVDDKLAPDGLQQILARNLEAIRAAVEPPR